MSEHCWHGIGKNTGEDREQVCCFCGIHYHPEIRIPMPGHGKYNPDTIRPPKPSGKCISREPPAGGVRNL